MLEKLIGGSGAEQQTRFAIFIPFTDNKKMEKYFVQVMKKEDRE